MNSIIDQDGPIKSTNWLVAIPLAISISTSACAHENSSSLPRDVNFCREESTDNFSSIRENVTCESYISKKKRIEKIKALRGKFAFVPTSSEEFIKRKHKEIEQEY